jgi:hypothetical protein
MGWATFSSSQSDVSCMMAASPICVKCGMLGCKRSDKFPKVSCDQSQSCPIENETAGTELGSSSPVGRSADLRNTTQRNRTDRYMRENGHQPLRAPDLRRILLLEAWQGVYRTSSTHPKEPPELAKCPMASSYRVVGACQGRS